ncbi:N-acetylmuramic acid 6-phosphate etherase [Sulfitobacter sp. LCG007]
MTSFPSRDRDARPLDALPRSDALRVMLASHRAAIDTIAGAIDEIDAAADVVAEAIARGGRLVYAAAGSSGLMALSDASELPGTFGIDPSQIRLVMAGGVPVDARMPGATEDLTEEARDAAGDVAAGDVAIVISASGTTPFALAFAETAAGNGARVIAISNRSGSPLLELADIAIALPTAPEVVAGSTRLGAGTAQKVALNMISTQAGILLGHVHDGLMVNLIPDNAKLRDRASGIVMQVTGVSREDADAAIAMAGPDTKRAILIASGATPDRARDLLARHRGRVGDALAALNDKTRN